MVFGLAFLAFTYSRGMNRLKKFGGFERQIGSGRRIAAMTGWLALVVAFFSPIGALDDTLLSAHMLQHLLIIQVAAPLLLLGRPVPTMILGLSPVIGQTLGRAFARSGSFYKVGSFITSPFASLGIFLVALFGWHIPAAYDLAVNNLLVHYLQHLTFFVSSLLFWWPAADPVTGKSTRRRYLSLLSQAAAFVAANAVGITFTFAGNVLYRSYESAPLLVGIAPKDDQVTAGVIMWVLGGLVYSVSALATLAASAAEAERQQERLERQPLSAA